MYYFRCLKTKPCLNFQGFFSQLIANFDKQDKQLSLHNNLNSFWYDSMWSCTLLEGILWHFSAVCLIIFINSFIHDSSSIWIIVMPDVSVDYFIGRFQQHGSLTVIYRMENQQLFRIHHLWPRQSILNAHYVIVMAVTKTLLHFS